MDSFRQAQNLPLQPGIIDPSSAGQMNFQNMATPEMAPAQLMAGAQMKPSDMEQIQNESKSIIKRK